MTLAPNSTCRGMRTYASATLLVMAAVACGGKGTGQAASGVDSASAPAAGTSTGTTVGPGAADTGKISPRVAGADTTAMPPDQRFLEEMSNHHQGLVQMAHYELEERKSPGVMADARKFDANQDAELDTMVTMLEKTYKDPYTPKLMPSNRAMLDTLKAAPAGAFDSTFRRLVIEHHAEGLRMMKQWLPTLTNPMLRTMVQRMQADQMRDTTQLRRESRRGS